MPSYADKTKEQKIKSHTTKLRGVFRTLDENKKKTVESLIINAAFMSVCLEELQAIINKDGYTEEYQNGANQKGVKQSEAVKTHIAMTRNHAAIIKTLADLAPTAAAKKTALQKLKES